MAEYEGKKVKLNDPFRLPSGSKKKFGVYVKNPKTGNVIKVEFGDPNLSIKRDDPERLKNFRARHNCDQKTDKTTPGYWSCKFWEKDKPVSKLLKKGKVESVGEGCGCDECMSEDKHDKKGKDMDPRKHVALSKKNPGMYCVFDVKGREVKLFKKKSDAEAYAIKNHDELMKESVNESRKKKITYVINRRTGEVVYGPTDVADAKQFLKKQPQPRKFVIRDIKEDVQLDETVKTAFKDFDMDARVFMAKLKKFGFDKEYRKMMQNFNKHAKPGDGFYFVDGGRQLGFEVHPVSAMMMGNKIKKLGDSQELGNGKTVKLIAIKESVQLDEETQHIVHVNVSRTGFRKLEAMIASLDGYRESDYSDGKARFYFDAKKHDSAERKKVAEFIKKTRGAEFSHAMKEDVQLDEQGSIVKTFGNTRDYMPLIKKFGMEKQFRSMMRDLKKFGESGDGLIMIYSDKMLEFIIEPLEDSHYVTKAAQRGGPMTGKNLVKKDVRARGAKGVDARVIAFKESEYNPLDEQKIRTQVEFDSLTDAVKSVKFHPTRDKGREVAIYKLTPPKRTMRTSTERPSGKKVGSVDFQKKTVYTTVTLPNGPFEKILKAKGAKRIATVKNVDGKAKVIKEQRVIQESGHEDVPSAKNKVMMNLVSLKKIHKILCCMDPHASLPSWLTDKLTIATSKLDTVGDYLESQVMQSESTDPNFWLIELNEDEDDKKKKGKNPRGTKYYTKSGRIKKSPEDKETGLPKKYVSRMTDADAKQKAAEIKARKKYDKDDPRRYKPTEVDKKYAGKGQKSKYTKAYDKMFGKDDD